MSVVELCHHGMIKSFCSTCRDEELTMLRYELSQARAQLEEATREATGIAVAIHRTRYPNEAQWKPLDDLRGVLTQIDNMVAGLIRELTEARENARAYKDAWLQARQAQMDTDLRAAKVREENERMRAVVNAAEEVIRNRAYLATEFGPINTLQKAFTAYRAESCPAAEEVPHD